MLPPREAFIWEGIGTQQIFYKGRRSPILTARRELYIVSPQAFAMLYTAVPRGNQISAAWSFGAPNSRVHPWARPFPWAWIVHRYVGLEPTFGPLLPSLWGFFWVSGWVWVLALWLSLLYPAPALGVSFPSPWPLSCPRARPLPILRIRGSPLFTVHLCPEAMLARVSLSTTGLHGPDCTLSHPEGRPAGDPVDSDPQR